jgi:hypothetical protein
VKTFVKAEKVDMAKGDPAPRVIQPRAPRYNLSVACYVKHLEKLIYRAIKRLWGSTTVFKGLNGVERGRELRKKWEKFGDPVAVGLDASRFDQHVSIDALKWEHKVYLQCYKDPSDRRALAELLAMQLRNHGVAVTADAVIKYVTRGCRMSGDMNTALGNCLLMSSMVWSWCQEANVVAELANDGDDCVVIIERRDLARFQRGLRAYFTRLGFTMKVEDPVNVFEEIVFCQSQPVFTGRGWVMVRDPRRALSKDLHSVLPLDDIRMAKGLCTAMGQGGTALCAGVPCCERFYAKLVERGEGVVIGRHPAMESGFSQLCRGIEKVECDITDEHRVSFWKAFGMLPSEQVLFEQMLELWTWDWTVERRESTEDFSGFWKYFKA